MVSLPTSIKIEAISLAVIDILAVGLRFHYRKASTDFGWDDWLCLPACFSAIGMSVCMLVGAFTANLGQHNEKLPNGMYPPPSVLLMKLNFILQLLSVVCLAFCKTSMLYLYKRIFRRRLLFEIIAALSVAWGIACFFATLFQCRPIHLMYTSNFITDPRCFKVYSFYYALAITNFVIDLTILCVPQPMLWRLKLPNKKKIGVSIIFLTGAFITGISIARITFFFRTLGLYSDLAFEIHRPLLWTQIEGNVAVLCICLPTFGPLCRKTFETCQGLYTSLYSLVTHRSSSGTSKSTLRDEHGTANMFNTNKHYMEKKTSVNTVVTAKESLGDQDSLEAGRPGTGQIGVQRTYAVEVENNYTAR